MSESDHLSLAALGRLVGELLDRLGLTDVTLVQNNWGGVDPDKKCLHTQMMKFVDSVDSASL